MQVSRFLTAIAIVAICTLTVWRGMELARYSLADARPEAARPWFDVSGVAFNARDYSLTVVNDSNEMEKALQRREEIADILTIRPLSARYWLSLAKMRQVTGEPSGKLFDAFILSILTGPNEGSILSSRGLFGVWQWESLSEELRDRTVAALTARRLSDLDVDWLRADLAQKPETVRQQIRIALQASGLSATELTRFGL